MPPLKLSEKACSLLRDFMLLFDLEDSFKGSTEVTESDATKVLEYIKSVFGVRSGAHRVAHRSREPA